MLLYSENENKRNQRRRKKTPPCEGIQPSDGRRVVVSLHGEGGGNYSLFLLFIEGGSLPWRVHRVQFIILSPAGLFSAKMAPGRPRGAERLLLRGPGTCLLEDIAQRALLPEDATSFRSQCCPLRAAVR